MTIVQDLVRGRIDNLRRLRFKINIVKNRRGNSFPVQESFSFISQASPLFPLSGTQELTSNLLSVFTET